MMFLNLKEWSIFIFHTILAYLVHIYYNFYIVVMVFGILSLLLSYLVIRKINPVLIKNDRGKRLVSAIESLGLVDIEQRIPEETNIPSLKTLQLAKRELVISGFSCQSILRNYENFFEEAIKNINKNIKIKILILHKKENEPIIRSRFPDNADAILNSIEDAIVFIKSKKWINENNFDLKFMTNIPPFTAIMIDGNIDCKRTEKPYDEESLIRIQPLTCYEEKSHGIILSLKKNKAKNKKVFDYFANDFRNQWQKAID